MKSIMRKTNDESSPEVTGHLLRGDSLISIINRDESPTRHDFLQPDRFKAKSKVR